MLDNICDSTCSAAGRIKFMYVMLLYDIGLIASVDSHFFAEILDRCEEQIDSYREV